MKCSNCGSEIADGIKYCKYCGHDNTASQVRICPRCQNRCNDATLFCKQCGFDFRGNGGRPGAGLGGNGGRPGVGPGGTGGRPGVGPGGNGGRPGVGPGGNGGRPGVGPGGNGVGLGDEPKGNKTLLIILLAIASIVILAILGFVGYKAFGSKLLHKEKEEAVQETTTQSEIDEIADDGEDENPGTTEEQFATTEEYEPEVTMDYCDNTYCDIDANQDLSAFTDKITSKDGRYSFVYPKYLFNTFEYDEEYGYYFSYVENGEEICTLHYYSVPCVGEIYSNATNIQNNLKSRYTQVSYYFPEDIPTEAIDEQGLVQVVVSGWLDYGKRKSQYVCCGNDGQTAYYMEITYPDADPDNHAENWDYVVNTLYRKCSFCGSKKAAYQNFSDFYKENKN